MKRKSKSTNEISRPKAEEKVESTGMISTRLNTRSEESESRHMKKCTSADTGIFTNFCTSGVMYKSITA